MKILRTDNFARESVSEYVVAENIQSNKEAEIMLNALIKTCTADGPNFYKLVEDEVEPYKFKP